MQSKLNSRSAILAPSLPVACLILGDDVCHIHIQAIDEISSSVGNLLSRCDGVVIIGGDHTISYPSLKVS